MAEIASSVVFTNDIVTCNTPDFLHQPFQETAEHDNNVNEFVTYLAADDGDSTQTIHLTHAQASALRLTFQVDSTTEGETGGIVYNQNPNDMLIEIQHDTKKDRSIELLQSVEQMECTSDTQWTIEAVGGAKAEALNMANSNNQVLENNSQPRNATNILMQQPETGTATHCNGPNTKCNAMKEITPIFHPCDTSSIHNETLPDRMPIILPSSQLIIKPAHTISKTGKSLRLIPNTNTIGSTNINAISSTNSICNITTHNSVLLSKATLINPMGTKIFKSIPVTPQSMHGNAISAQLLDSSQILTCDVLQSPNFNNCNSDGFIENGVAQTSANTSNNPTRVFPLNTTTSNITIHRNSSQQSSASSVSRSTCESISMLKSHVSNETPSSIAGSFSESVRLPTQKLITTSVTVGKPSNFVIPKKVSADPSSSMMVKTGSRLKTQQFKKITASASTAIHHRIPTHSTSTPVSILKPQTRLTCVSAATPNSMLNSQNITNLNYNHTPGAKQVPRMALNNYVTKPPSTSDNKLRLGESSIPSSTRIVRKPKIPDPSQSSSILALNDAGKPLGSNENPIQIIQQGHTFHSMQKLTQSQLKQIAHALQQRSQESADPNERVVYRVVFPEELDLRIRNPINLIKGRAGKRGRPKKKLSTATKFSTHDEDVVEDIKDEKKKPVARTRSGRLSRPPRHIVRDYKHLHHLDLLQPDLDDSDGGYSDYNVCHDKLGADDVTKDLLTGYEGPKRKISDHFRCPTCNKIYLGRTRMAKHFEIHPDHGNTDQLPPRTAEQGSKTNAFPTDTFKRKGKKRGPWAYITPEAKSERRQIKLKEALSACDNGEIIKIAAKPLLNAQSLFDLMVLKSNNSLKVFLNELKILMNKTREQVNDMLSPMNDNDKYEDMVKLDDKLLCDTLGLEAGLYYVRDDAFNKSTDFYNTSITPTSLSSPSPSPLSSSVEEPPTKVLKVNNDDGKADNGKKLSSELSEPSDINTHSNFLTERNLDLINTNCPEVLTALTLMPRGSGLITPEACKTNNISKLLISNTEIQSQISDNPGFQKIDINSSQSSSFKKMVEMDHTLDISNFSSSVFPKLDDNYEQSKSKSLSQTFIKLEPTQQGFVKLKNGNIGTYHKEESQIFRKPQDGFENMNGATQIFTKGFQKLISKMIPVCDTDDECVQTETSIKTAKNDRELPDNMPAIQCDASIFDNTENLDLSKITNYDLDVLSNDEVIDKHLIMDGKLVEQLHLVDQSNLVDELVSERLKNIMPDNILGTNLMTNNSNMGAELDFEALSEEFNRNTRS